MWGADRSCSSTNANEVGTDKKEVSADKKGVGVDKEDIGKDVKAWVWTRRKWG
jgi:hypothetical protein